MAVWPHGRKCIFVDYNSETITNKWLHLYSNQVLTSRQKTFITHKTNKNKVGLNALANRLYILNGRIPLDWLNLSINSFKTKCRIEILKVWSSTIHKNIAPYLPSNPKFCLHTGYSKPQPYRGLTSCLSYLQSEANREQIWLYGWVIACHGFDSGIAPHHLEQLDCLFFNVGPP